MSKRFSKRAKLSKLDHLFIIAFIIGAAYLGIVWRLIPFAAVYLIAILYLIFIASLEFKNTKGKIYQSAIAKEERRYSTISARTETTPKVRKTYKKPIDFNDYIAKATNHNLFVAGSSGTGKTTLMRYMISIFPDSAKTIFSFKVNDDYLKLDIPILKVAEYAGDPFADKEAFVQAFLVAYPISSQGVVAASLPNLLRTLAKKSDSWRAFSQNIDEAMKREKPSSITHSAYSFIQQKLADLELSSIPCPIDYDKSIVLDFSGLNETAKSFYAELYLRQAWSHIEASKDSSMGHIIVIDEAHRLLKSEATIFGEIARLIRSKGALWCGTQNYSDLPDYISNQFATHLLFGTRSESDLRALKEINPLLPFVATEMPEHHFTDVASRELHTAIPLYIADIRNFKDYPESYIKPEPGYAQKAQEVQTLDYRAKVLEMLESEASWPSKLAKDIAKAEGMADEPKLAVSKALKVLQTEGLVARQALELEDKEVMLYYRRDPSMSGLHKFMVNEVIKKLEEKGIEYTLAKPGEDKPDIITKDFDIEVETGLKHDIKELEKKAAHTNNRVYVLVPNQAEKDKYKNIKCQILIEPDMNNKIFNLYSKVNG